MINRVDILVKVASMFYEENMTQTEISKELNLSRPTIASMLNEAKEKGIVKISIVKLGSNTHNLAKKIEKKFNLKRVMISPEDTDNAKHDIGVLCAEYIESRSDEKIKIGLGFGTTLFEYIKNSNYIPTNFRQIVPLIGGVEMDNEALHCNHLCFALARKYHTSVKFFYSPVKAEDINEKNMLMDSRLVVQSLKNAREVDLAIVGVGNPLKNSTYRRLNYITKEDNEILKQKKAVGDIVTTFYDINADEIETPLTEKFIGLKIGDLKKINEIVTLASGEEKYESILALLNAKIIDTLIIDYELANLLNG